MTITRTDAAHFPNTLGGVGVFTEGFHTFFSTYTNFDDNYTSNQLKLWVDRPGRRIHQMLSNDVSALYTQLSLSHPWKDHDWFSSKVTEVIEHVIRPSKTLDGNLAYYQTPEKRARGILTPIKPGRYLKKFFSDVLTEEQIQVQAFAWMNQFTPADLKVTQDADEIEQVYRGRYNGSCMQFDTGCFRGDQHPARAYAGPDLGIAYIGDKKSADARTLVWPEKKIFFPKFYGDSHRIEAALQAAGYKAGDDDDFLGARLRRLPYEGTFVLPYVDVAAYCKDDGEFIILDEDGDIDCRNTSGLGDNGGAQYYCDECDDRYREEGTLVANGNRVCSRCLDNDYLYCDVLHDYYQADDFVSAPSHYNISAAATRQPDLTFYCSHSEMHYPCEAFDKVEMANGDTWAKIIFNDHGRLCEFSMKFFPLDELETLPDGRRYAPAEVNDDFPTWADPQPELALAS